MKMSIIKMLIIALFTSFISFGTGMSNSYAQQKDTPNIEQDKNKNKNKDRDTNKKDKKKKDKKKKDKKKKNSKKHKHHKKHKKLN